MRIQAPVFIIQAGIRGVPETIAEIDGQIVVKKIGAATTHHFGEIEAAAKIVALKVVIHDAQPALDIGVERDAEIKMIGQHRQHQADFKRACVALKPPTL